MTQCEESGGPPLLSVDRICIEYAGAPPLVAVDDVSLSVRRGERLGIVGESGSGKSTLVNALLGFVEEPGHVRGGGIWFDGTDMLRASEVQLRDIRGKSVGMIFQDPLGSLNPVYTVGRQVVEALRAHSRGEGKVELRARAEQLLTEVGVPNVTRRMHQYPHEFSGGMCQRVVITMAMANSPSLIVADEPTSALDVTTQRSVLELLLRVSEERSTSTIIVTHDLGVVTQFAQRVVVMYAGAVMESGPVSTVFRAPHHPYTRALLDAIPRLDDPGGRRLHTIPGSLPRPGEVTRGCLYEPRCFVGRGRELCQTSRPLPRAISADISVACHFAEPRPANRLAALPSVERSPVKADNGPVLEVTGLTKRYRLGNRSQGRNRTFAAVDDVSFWIDPGEFLGLVGESGSGKTTLARMILGLTSLDEGTVCFRSKPLTSGKRGERAGRIQVVFQDPGESLNPRMNIHAIVAEPLKLGRFGPTDAVDRRVHELLKQVAVGVERASAYPDELSGGQRQRVALARAIATTPPVLVFDEAVSNLDVSVHAQVLNLISDLRSELGIAALFISHDLSVIRRVCDRVLVMYKGKIVESASANELFGEPRHPYTVSLIASIPSTDPEDSGSWRFVEREARQTSGPVDEGGCPYAPMCEKSQGRCHESAPELVPAGEDHAVACYFPYTGQERRVARRDAPGD